jgi:hypothetical protein
LTRQTGIANLKLILLSFEMMSGLKINFARSEVIVVGTTHPEQVRIADLLNCKLGKIPISYLGLPVNDKDSAGLRLGLPHWQDEQQGGDLASAEKLEPGAH